MITHTNNHAPQAALGRMSYREIMSTLSEKDSHGDVKTSCIAEPLRDPTDVYKSVLHITNPYDQTPVLQSLRSRVEAAEVRAILSGIVPIEEFCKTLDYIVSSYRGRSMAIIEGDTSLGKTLAIDTFTKLLYGSAVEPLDFYCVGQTDVSELLGKWVPNVETGTISSRLNAFRESEFGKELLDKLALATRESVDFYTLGAEINKALELPGGTQWVFQLGAIPKAMQGTFRSNGEFYIPADKPVGTILHLEEIGLAKPAVLDTCLRLRGKHGRLSRSIQIWEDGGRRIVSGDEFFVISTTNPPENYIERTEIDGALARGGDFLRLKKMKTESLRMYSRRLFSGELPSEEPIVPPIWATDLRSAKELGSEIASLLTIFHEKASEALKSGEPGRAQRIPPTLDDFDRVYRRLMTEQVLVDGPRGMLEVDINATLTRAVTVVYFDRLATDKMIKTLSDSWREFLENDLGAIDFRGKRTPRAEVLNTLTREYIDKLPVPKAAEEPIDLALVDIRTQTLVEQARDRIARLTKSGVLTN